MLPRLVVFLSLFLGTIAVEGQTPVFEVTRDDFKVAHDVTLRIDPDRVIADTNQNGVIQIVADHVTVTWLHGPSGGDASGADQRRVKGRDDLAH